MLDPKLLRETPDLVRAAIAKKHLEVDVDAVLALDAAWRTQLQEVEALRGVQKAANTAGGRAGRKGSAEFIAKVMEMKAVSAQAKERDVKLKESEEKLQQAMLLAAESAACQRARRAHTGGQWWWRRRLAIRRKSERTRRRTAGNPGI